MPKVSIVVPVYNMQKYLAACIKSLKAQTLSDIEIILVDDGSSDNSPALCEAYAQENPVDFALLDIDMPEMNGIELARRLRQLRPGMIVIFVTGAPSFMFAATMACPISW